MKRSLFDFLAVSVWVVHLAWTLLLVAGIALVFFVPWYGAIHLILISGTLLLNLALRDCPLTMVERVFHLAAGSRIELRSFSDRLFGKIGLKLSSSGVNKLLTFVKIGSYTATILVIFFR